MKNEEMNTVNKILNDEKFLKKEVTLTGKIKKNFGLFYFFDETNEKGIEINFKQMLNMKKFDSLKESSDLISVKITGIVEWNGFAKMTTTTIIGGPEKFNDADIDYLKRKIGNKNMIDVIDERSPFKITINSFEIL